MKKTVLSQLWLLFNRRERWQLAALSVALLIRAGVEMVGVASIMPFMSVVADPSVIETNEWLHLAYDRLGFTSATAFLTVLGIAVVVLLAASNAVSALAVWGMLRFAWGAHHRLAVRLFAGYLAQPLYFFVDRNSASFSKSILTEVQQVIQGVLTPVLEIVARSLVVLALTGLLILLDPMLAFATVLVLGGAYGFLFLLIKAKQGRLGRERVDANQHRFKITAEAFGGIKDVKVLQRESSFAMRFKRPSWTFSQAMASNATIAQLPRYLLETIAFGGIVLIVLYYLRVGEGVNRILPTISLYAFAGYRLMPELQKLFAGVAAIRFNRAALDDLTDDLERFVPHDRTVSPLDAVSFEDGVRFENVTFRYPGASKPALDGVSLTIPHERTIGIVGASGSGKTTLVDLLLGLYEPENGKIFIDDLPLAADTIGAWRRRVGYVPQQIFLCDDTIANNIAFGVPETEVNRDQVERAARIAHLDGFITTLPSAYESVVGERGIRLSGGQRQRIGIARALYHDPDVLIMDEATSALDGATEGFVMEAIHALTGKKTIVLIAHRLTTVQDSSCIFLMEQGKVVESGTFDELSAQSNSFRSLAKMTALSEE